MNEVVVNMQDHFDLTDAEQALAEKRFAMPPVVVAAFRQAAAKGAAKLLEMIEGEKFDKMPTKEKLAVLNMVFDRAYGRSESQSAAVIAAHRTGEGAKNNDHGKQLEAIAARAAAHRQRFPALSANRLPGEQQPVPIGDRTDMARARPAPPRDDANPSASSADAQDSQSHSAPDGASSNSDWSDNGVAGADGSRNRAVTQGRVVPMRRQG